MSEDRKKFLEMMADSYLRKPYSQGVKGLSADELNFVAGRLHSRGGWIAVEYWYQDCDFR